MHLCVGDILYDQQFGMVYSIPKNYYDNNGYGKYIIQFPTSGGEQNGDYDYELIFHHSDYIDVVLPIVGPAIRRL